MFNKSVFIFRRDFRLDDNITLNEALKNSETVIPVFIFTPEQIDKNKYKSHNCIQFMVESLIELDAELRKLGSKLFYFYDDYQTVVKSLIKEGVDAIYFNMDYTKYSVNRDKTIATICKENGVECISHEDVMLNNMGTVVNGSGKPFMKFTSYFNAAKNLPVKKPLGKNKYKNFYKNKNKLNKQSTKSLASFIEKTNDLIHVRGGRTNALEKLKLIKNQKSYNTTRDSPSISTTNLSAYMKFGCVSIREVYYAFAAKLPKSNALFQQLFWRDFYYNIAFNYPHVFGGPLQQKYEKLKWDNNKQLFNKWKTGTTGFPLVDAGMRQLITTGFMHNRARLVTSNFLIKVLRVNWLYGEQFYATQLVDYDPSINNGNWQFNSSTGSSVQNYFASFNPWIQSFKHDKECIYIKKWIPELKDVPNKDIHTWNEQYNKYPNVKYPKPITDYKAEIPKTLKMYNAVVKK